MKTFSMLSLSLGIALLMGNASCNNQEGGRSTPLDSTNDLGTAPVQYQAGTPDVTTDSTMQTTPMDTRARQDSANSRSMQDAQGKNNTTDPNSSK